MLQIINGPNLNMLGQRDPEIYGRLSLDDIIGALRQEFPDERIEAFQSNCEGEIIDCIQRAGHESECRGIVINPGAYAHYSYAIADALRDCARPAVEVHISNIHAREEFRSRSVTAAACRGVISGLGADVYRLAASYLLSL